MYRQASHGYLFEARQECIPFESRDVATMLVAAPKALPRVAEKEKFPSPTNKIRCWLE